MNFKTFFETNKPLIAGIVGALTIILQQAVSAGDISWKAIGVAALVATLGAIGKYFKGGNFTVAGIIGAVSTVVATSLETGKFDGTMTILACALAVMGLFGQSLQPKEPVDEDAPKDPVVS